MTDFNESHIIKVVGEIDDDLSKDFLNSILECTKNPSQEIIIIINSDGGCIYSAFAMHDMLKHVKNPIVTIGIGRVMSAAVLLLAAGDRREIMANTSIMMHEPSLSDFNLSDEMKVGDLRRELDHIEELKNRMYKLLAKYSGQKLKTLTRDLEGRDFYLNAKEAKEYGLVDVVCAVKNSRKIL